MKLSHVSTLLAAVCLLSAFMLSPGQRPGVEESSRSEVRTEGGASLSSCAAPVGSSAPADVKETSRKSEQKRVERASLRHPAGRSSNSSGDVFDWGSGRVDLGRYNESSPRAKNSMPDSSADNSELEEFAESILSESVSRSPRSSAGSGRSGSPADLPIGTVGERYCRLLESIRSSSAVRYVLYRGALPKGLSIYAASGLLCGVPEESGVFTFTAAALNSSGEVRISRFSLTIKDLPAEEDASSLEVVTSSLAPATVGAQYSVQLAASGGRTPYSWSVQGLPGGFAFDSRTGQLSGAADSPAVYSLEASVQDSEGSFDARSLTLEVRDAPIAITTQQLDSAVVGREYSFAFAAVGGAPSYRWQLVSGVLPGGLSFNSTRGVIEGSAEEALQTVLRIRVTDQAGASDEVELQFDVFDAAFSIVTSSIVDSVPGAEWLLQFEAQGGREPLMWSAAGGSLPQGVTLSEAGLWQGTAEEAAEGTVVIEVRDADGRRDQRTFVWRVAEAELRIATDALAPPFICFEYSAEITAVGGNPPYLFSLQDGMLPSGVVLSPGGTFSGTPDTVLTASFSVLAQDASGAKTEKLFILDVQQAPLETAFESNIISAQTGVELEYILSSAGGCPPLQWSVQYTSWPVELEFEHSGMIFGTPSEPGDYPFSAIVRDSLGSEAQAELRIVVAEGPLLLKKESLRTAVAGSSYSDRLDAAGGSPPLVYSLVAGALPDGLLLEAETGIVRGIPEQAGEYPVVFEVKDAGGSRAVREYIFEVQPGVLQIVTEDAEFESARLNDPLSVAFRAQGGEGEYRWQADAAVLSEWGLTISSSGVLSGYLSKTGECSFIVTVEDGRGERAAKPVTFSVQPGELHIVSAKVFDEGLVGEWYEHQLEAEGGAEPYLWSLKEGELPGGLQLDASAGRVYGTPEAASELQQFVVGVVDALGAAASQVAAVGIRGEGLPGIQGLAAVPSDGKIGLVWHNPSFEGFAGVQLLRSTAGYPKSAVEGEVVYEGSGFHIVDGSLQEGIKYYYSARALYDNGSYSIVSDSSKAAAVPVEVALTGPADPFIDSVADFQPLDPSNCYGCSKMPQVVLGYPQGGAQGAGSDNVVSLHARVNNDGGASAPYGGSILVTFSDNIVVNGPGVDFTVFENAFRVGGSDEIWSEPAIVEVSVDGITFYRFPFDFVPHYDSTGQLNLSNRYCYAEGFAGVSPVYSNPAGPDPSNPAVSGGDFFDLSSITAVELQWIQYIRITSTGDAWLRDKNGDLVRHSHVSPSWGASGTGNSGFDLDAVCAVNY